MFCFFCCMLFFFSLPFGEIKMNIAHRVTNSVLNRILLLAVQNDIYCIDNLYNVHYVPKELCHLFATSLNIFISPKLVVQYMHNKARTKLAFIDFKTILSPLSAHT